MLVVELKKICSDTGRSCCVVYTACLSRRSYVAKCNSTPVSVGEARERARARVYVCVCVCVCVCLCV